SLHSFVLPSSDLDPPSIPLRRLDGRLDEGNSLQAVVEIGKEDGLVPRLSTFAPRQDGFRDLGVDVGETLEIPFRMSGGNARHARRGGPGACATPRDEAFRFAEGRVPEIVRIGLRP